MRKVVVKENRTKSHKHFMPMPLAIWATAAYNSIMKLFLMFFKWVISKAKIPLKQCPVAPRILCTLFEPRSIQNTKDLYKWRDHLDNKLLLEKHDLANSTKKLINGPQTFYGTVESQHRICFKIYCLFTTNLHISLKLCDWKHIPSRHSLHVWVLQVVSNKTLNHLLTKILSNYIET